MSKIAAPLKCSRKVRAHLETWARSRTIETRLSERAKIILGCLQGEQVHLIAENLKIRPNTVIAWRHRFEKEGMAGLYDQPRSGKPSKYGDKLRNQVLLTLEQAPPKGQACWDGPTLAAHLNVSADAVWRVLRREGICLARHRNWCVSTDPQFATKAADIVGLYLNPPENAMVVSVDEKPSIQALERASGYVLTSSGKIVRGMKSTYKRHGTLNLFAALEVATGAIHTQLTKQKRPVEFLAFMDKVVAEFSEDRELHVILDNYCIHKKNDAWLAAHSNVFFHFTPTSASWLNQVEIWFGIFSRKALRGASFCNTEQLRQAIENYITAYGPTAKPFIWCKREVKGAQLKNTIENFCI